MKILKRVLIGITILIIAFIIFILNETKDEVNATLANIDERINNYYNEQKMAGFSVAVFNADHVLYTNGFGYADIENRSSYTIQTQQYIASIAKTTISVSLMKAEELGLLNINDPINDHLPFQVINPNFTDKDITIHHLATHTSSLDYNERVVESLYVNESEKQKIMLPFMENYFVNNTYGKVLFTKDEPGTNWNYSNIGAGLAAYIIEHKSGMSYADFTKKYIFDPLSMSDTHWFEAEADSSRYSNYYEENDTSLLAKVEGQGVILYPARDWITTAEDLTIYCQAIMKRDDRLLSQQSFEKMLNHQLTSKVTNQNGDKHGLFWMIDRNQYGITYQLTGLNGGDNCINTMMWFDPKTELGYIFIGNTGGSEKNRGNHIWIYRALVSLGDQLLMDKADNTILDKIGYKWHNLYNRVRALF